MDSVPLNWDLENRGETMLREELGPNFKSYGSIVVPKLSNYSLIIITLEEGQFQMFYFGSAIEQEVSSRITKFLESEGVKAKADV